VVVDLAPMKKFKKTVTLEQLKGHSILSTMALVKQSRLSVTPVKVEEFDLVLALAGE